MLVLDTNVVSELMRPEPTPIVAAWIAGRDAAEMYLTAISEAELRFGIAILPVGRRRDVLDAALRRWLEVGFSGRILPFESRATRAYAEIAAERRQSGQPIGAADCQIAAIVRSHGGILVTRNVRDFDRTEVEVVDPWAEA